MTEFAISGRARLAYQSTGAGCEVLLIHAGVTDRRSWRQLIEALGDGYRCVAFDMRGYGETEYEPQDGWSPVDDALAVLDAAGLERPIVIGGSMGGQLAIDLALARPDRVSGLVLIGTAVRGAPYPELESGPTASLERLIAAAYEADDIDEVGRLETWMWLDGPGAREGRVAGAVRELFREMNGVVLRADDPGEEAGLAEAWERLGEIDVPTLLLVGRLDADDIRLIDEQAAALIPGARLVWLDGVAHVPHLEGDPPTLDQIVAFVGDLRASAASD